MSRTYRREPDYDKKERKLNGIPKKNARNNRTAVSGLNTASFADKFSKFRKMISYPDIPSSEEGQSQGEEFYPLQRLISIGNFEFIINNIQYYKEELISILHVHYRKNITHNRIGSLSEEYQNVLSEKIYQLLQKLRLDNPILSSNDLTFFKELIDEKDYYKG